MEQINYAQLSDYLRKIGPKEAREFAKRCGTTREYLSKAISAKQRFSFPLCQRFEQFSGGIVQMEPLCPDVDWSFLRSRFSREQGCRMAADR
jgi:DNA-binding transcriptional regulator YdaS (Cro superfamily)